MARGSGAWQGVVAEVWEIHPLGGWPGASGMGDA